MSYNQDFMPLAIELAKAFIQNPNVKPIYKSSVTGAHFEYNGVVSSFIEIVNDFYAEIEHLNNY